ncbi:MAG: AsmA-like C-terminal region-containing protein [Cyclobacteriaceae bacterium]|nr:membrane biogenesis protein [Cyclobacteriaceae bacterium]MCH8516539.1 AsmA-like C-terminal region-containing protein [Cyclobacteriaceae bacterium]
MLKYKKAILITLAVIFTLLIVSIVAAPYVLYKNQKTIVQKVLTEVNDHLDGEIVIEDSYISPFKSFPYISIDLHNVRFYEGKARENKALYFMEDIYLGFSIYDLIKGNFVVKSLLINGGYVNVIQLESGEYNILLAKGIKEMAEKQEEAEEEGEFALDLQQFKLSNFHVSKKNEANLDHIEIDIDFLDISFKKDREHILASLKSDLLLNFMTAEDTSFIRNKHITLNTKLDYDKSNQLLTIDPSKLRLEDADFLTEGTIDFANDLDLNLQFKGDKPDFNLFIAFAPPELAENLKRYDNSGRIFFEASVIGRAAEGYSPKIEAKFGCENAYFLNREINKKIDELGFVGYYTNGEDRNLETSEFRLMDFVARPDEGIFRGSFVARNFLDPYIAMNVYSELDLEFLGNFFGVEGLRRLKGQVILNMEFDELIDIDMPAQSMSQLKEGIQSDLTVKDLGFIVPGYPHPIKNVNLHAEMSEGFVRLDSLSFTIDDSDFYFSGSLSDLPAIFHGHDKKIRMDLNTRSKQVNVPNLLSHDSSLQQISNEIITDFNLKLAFESTVNQLTQFENLPVGEFFIEGFQAKLKNYPHTFHDFYADILIDHTQMRIKDFRGEIDDSDFHFTGKLINYDLWFSDNKKGDTEFHFDLDSKLIVPKDLLSYEGENFLPEDYREERLEDVLLKGHVYLHYDSILTSTDLHLELLQAKLNLHPLKFEKFMGRVHIEDDHLLVEEFSGKMGKSDFKLDMAYFSGENTVNRKKDSYLRFSSSYLDMDALMNFTEEDLDTSKEVDHDDAFNIFELPFTDMSIMADIKTMKYHTIHLKDFYTEMRLTEDHFLHVDTLRTYAAGGFIGMNGYFNGSNPDNIYFHSVVHPKDVQLDQFLIKFDNFGQDMMVSENLKGSVSGTIKSSMHMHADLTPILDDSEAEINLMIKNGELIDFAPMTAMASFFGNKNMRRVRFDTLSNMLTLKEGTLHIPAMTINSSIGYMELSGKQSLDLDMEYFIRVPWKLVGQVARNSLFGRKSQEEIDADQEDEIIKRDENSRTRFVNVKLTGNPDQFNFSMGRDKEAKKAEKERRKNNDEKLAI